MKLFKSIIASVICASAFVTSAHATLITNTISQNPDTLINPTTPKSFTQSLLMNGFSVGMTLSSAVFHIRLTDTTSNENVRITLGGGLQVSNFGNVQNQTVDTSGGTIFDVILNTAALLDLQTDGLINVIISAPTAGDSFYFAESVLEATADGAVPEPGSLALLGLGLAGVAALRARKPT